MRTLSRTEYSIINMFTGMAGYVINTIIGFLCRIIFVRTLEVEYLGISGLFSNVLSMLSLAELGISSAITFALYQPIANDDKSKINAIMHFYKKTYIIIGVVIAVVGLALVPFLDIIITDVPNIKENIYMLYLLYLLNTVVSYFFSYKASLMIAMQRQYIVSGYNYVVTIVQSVIQIIYLLFTHEYIYYLLIQIIGGIFYNIWISKKTSIDYPYIDSKCTEYLSKDEKKNLFVNIKALAINKISGVLVNSTDNIAITYFTGLGSVGYASNYILLSSTLGALIGQVFNALPGSVGNLNASSNKDKQFQLFQSLNLLNFWLFGWGAIGIIFVSSDIVKLLFGLEYVLPFYIPLIIAINSYSIGMLQACYTFKSTLGLFKYGQYLLFFTGFINLILDILFGRAWGTFGIFFATLIARMCTNLWYEPYSVFKYGLNRSPLLYFKRYLKFACVLIITGLICYILCSNCNSSLMINLLTKIIICSAIPNMIFYLFFGKTKEFKYIFNNVKQAVKNLVNKLIKKRGE